MLYQINVMTLENQYEEKIYGVSDAINRIIEIQECDNVVGIDLISMETGEVLYSETTSERYISTELVIQMGKEILKDLK